MLVRRISILGTILGLVFSIGIFPVSATAVVECPQTWNEKLADLNITRVEGVSEQIPYQIWNSNLNGTDPIDSNLGLSKKIAELGQNVVWTTYYQVSRDSKFENLKVLKPLENPSATGFLREFPTQDFALRSFGFANGDFVRFVLDISVKGCAKALLTSNVVQIQNLYDVGIGLEKYLSYGNVNVKPLNFQQIELIKKGILNNEAKIKSNLNLGKEIVLERIKDETLDFYWEWRFLPISGDKCFEFKQWNGIGSTLTFLRFPCQVGLYGYVSLNDIKREGSLKNWQVGRPFAYYSLISKNTWVGKNQALVLKCKKGATTKIFTGNIAKCPVGFKKIS